MFHPTGLASLLTLVLLVEWVVAAPAHTPHSDVTVSFHFTLFPRQLS